jgi:hypothetical protein
MTCVDLRHGSKPQSRHVALVAQRHVGEVLDFNVALTGNEDVRTPAIIGTQAMSDKAEAAAIRLWRDRAHLREHERDEAQARARIAEEKVAILTAENDRLADEIARLRALLNPDAAQARAETEQQMKDLKTALLALLDQSEPPHSRSANIALAGVCN